MILQQERKEIVDFGIRMCRAGLTTGTGGNLSRFCPDSDRIVITPSGVPYQDMQPADVLVVTPDGTIVDGCQKPSSEAGFHLALYSSRPDILAVVHTHSVYATTFACLNKEILPVHYLVGFAGDRVPVAPYATYGTKALAGSIIDTIEDYNAVLLANHGLVAVGANLTAAFNVAEEIEFAARVYYQTLAIGDPVVLTSEQMALVIEKFKNYGPAQS